MRGREVRAISVLCLCAAVLLGSLFAPGCRFVESTTDTLAKGTRMVGATQATTVLEGTARAAESMRDYSPSEVHYIGRAVAVEILGRYKLHADDDLQRYVNRVGLAVALVAPDVRQPFSGRYHFAVLEGDQVQAVSAPGGFVFITEGAVRRAKDEDELAAVLAHEIAHVSLNHGIGAIKAATRKRSFALFAKAAGGAALQATGVAGAGEAQRLAELASVFGQAAQEITADLLVKGYNRDQELEADATAATYLQSSGYTRAALASYLKGLGAEGGKGGWFDTHPSAAERVAKLGDLAPADTPGREARAGRFLALVKK